MTQGINNVSYQSESIDLQVISLQMLAIQNIIIAQYELLRGRIITNNKSLNHVLQIESNNYHIDSSKE